MKKISMIIAALLVIFLILPALVLAHGSEEPMPTAPTKKSAQMPQEMHSSKDAPKAQPTKTSGKEMKQPQEAAKAAPVMSVEDLYKLRDAGILSLFLMMMAIGFAGFVGYSRRYNV